MRQHDIDILVQETLRKMEEEKEAKSQKVIFEYSRFFRKTKRPFSEKMMGFH